MKADIDKIGHGGPNLETKMKIVMWIMLASLVLFVTGLFVGYLRNNLF